MVKGWGPGKFSGGGELRGDKGSWRKAAPPHQRCPTRKRYMPKFFDHGPIVRLTFHGLVAACRKPPVPQAGSRTQLSSSRITEPDIPCILLNLQLLEKSLLPSCFPVRKCGKLTIISPPDKIIESCLWYFQIEPVTAGLATDPFFFQLSDEILKGIGAD